MKKDEKQSSLLVDSIIVQQEKTLYIMNINYFFDFRSNYFLQIAIVTEKKDLSQELITTRIHRTIFIFFF